MDITCSRWLAMLKLQAVENSKQLISHVTDTTLLIPELLYGISIWYIFMAFENIWNIQYKSELIDGKKMVVIHFESLCWNQSTSSQCQKWQTYVILVPFRVFDDDGWCFLKNLQWQMNTIDEIPLLPQTHIIWFIWAIPYKSHIYLENNRFI